MRMLDDPKSRIGRVSISVSAAWALIALCACGRIGRPYAPEDVVPQAVGDLTQSREEGEIVLTWSVPRENTNGWPLDDLAGFRVLRKIETAAFVPVAEIAFDREKDGPTVRRIRYREPAPTRGDRPRETASFAEEISRAETTVRIERRKLSENLSMEVEIDTAEEARQEMLKFREKVLYKVVSFNSWGYLSPDSNVVTVELSDEKEKAEEPDSPQRR